MASKEGQPPGAQPPEGRPNPEQEPAPYYQAARFPGDGGEQPSGFAYFQAQEAIFEDAACDLSAYRFQLDRVYHVAVMGEPPSNETNEVLAEILSAGEPVSLQGEVLKALQGRREQAKGISPWLEGHYRPGLRLDE